MRGYLTSYMKESPFVLFANGASNSCNAQVIVGLMPLLRFILDRCDV